MTNSRVFAIVAVVALSTGLPVATASISDAWEEVSTTAEDIAWDLATWTGLGEPDPTYTAEDIDEALAPIREDGNRSSDTNASPNTSPPEPTTSPTDEAPPQNAPAPQNASADATDAAPPADIAFGMHASGVKRLSNQDPAVGDQLEYGQVWVGAWNLRHGWSGVDKQLAWMAENNVTPVIQVFYWGNDIAPRCFQEGCDGKSTAGWSLLIDELGTQLDRHMQGQEAIVVLEPEFNEGHVATYEPLDAALAEKAHQTREAYPNATVALGMGGWAPQFWDTWDRAMEASDVMGLQLMRASTQDSRSTYANAAETLVQHTERLNELSGKPVLVTDVALATYPGGETYRQLQAQELSEILDRTDELGKAQVQGIIYRALEDDPSATTQEYYGQAEVTWGLREADGSPKPAWDVFKRGLQTHAEARS